MRLVLSTKRTLGTLNRPCRCYIWSSLALSCSSYLSSALAFSTNTMPGRGDYYKNKYGGGSGGGRKGRGGGGGGGRIGRSPEQTKRGRFEGSQVLTVGGSFFDLQQLLQNIDGKSYPAYHGLEHEWHHHDHQGKTTFRLLVGRAQSDPYAPPTRCQIRIPAEQFVSHWPDAVMQQQPDKVARVAATDYLLRHLYQTCQTLGADESIRSANGGWSRPKGGDLQILAPSQHVVEQSAVQIGMADSGQHEVVLQITINLPARGRTVLGKVAEKILLSLLPQLVQSLTAIQPDALWQHIHSVQDQTWLQDQLAIERLVAFIPDGAVLPRRSGVDDRPMLDAVPFASPLSLQRTFVLPSSGKTITGMGIPEGVTLICGGGFHGKSTLLYALQWGVYPKIPGDGREFCVTRPRATTIRAEDGRSVQASNISDFLKDLPGKSKDTTHFSTENASGSTSQASNIVEAVEVGAEALLMDEDTCATNALIRDEKMLQLVALGKDPITPFVRIVRSLYEQMSISTILVMGGSGDYFSVADKVLVMDSYICEDATDRAKEIASRYGANSDRDNAVQMPPLAMVSARPREIAQPNQIHPGGKIKSPRTGLIVYGENEIDCTSIEQIVSASQTLGIALVLQKLSSFHGRAVIRDTLITMDEQIDRTGLDTLAPGQFHGMLTRPRMIDVAAALNRIRIPGAIDQQK